MKTLGIATALLALGAQQQPPPAPIFRATTRLVELSVTVLDKKGQAVIDLQQADFTIQDEGKTRPIAFFRYDGGRSTEPNTKPLPAGLFTNRVEVTPGPPLNITALVLDELNTPPQSSVRVRAMTMRYLKALAPQTRMAVYQMSDQLRVLQDFTDDADALRAKIAKAAIAQPLHVERDFDEAIIEAEQLTGMFGDAFVRNQLEVEMLANAQSRAARLDKTLASIESLGRHLAGIPGRKNLVWLGGGISMISVTGAMGAGPHGSIDSSEDKVRRTSQRLAQQGVVLYIVDAKGLSVPKTMSAERQGTLPMRGRGQFEPQQDAENMSSDTQPAMELMAAITGGRYLYNTNDLAEGFKKAASDLAGSYTLGFYVSDEPDSKWHNLKASVKRPGVNLRHRKGYLAEPVAAAPVVWTNDMAMAAISNPIGSSEVQLTVSYGSVPGGEPGTLAVNVQIEPDSLRFQTSGSALAARIEVLFAERASDGRTRFTTDAPTVTIPAQAWEKAQEDGIRYTRQWKPASDAISLRVIVRDMLTGRYGTLDVPLKPKK
jgi:VWFA-related protein